MKIYMLVKYDGICEEIESIHTDEDIIVTSGEIESIRNANALKRAENMRWKIDIIELNNIK